MNTFHIANKHWLGVVVCALIITLGLVGCWKASVPIPHPVSLYAYAQCVGDINSFYVIGGADEWDQPLDYFLRFDASQGIWYRLAPLPTPSMASAASCYQGRIYVVSPEQNLYIYDIAIETWFSGSPPPRSAWGAAMGTWDDKLYLVGGSPGEWRIPTDEISVYDIETDSWINSHEYVMPVAASLPGYVQAGPFLYLAGGFGTQSPTQNVDATQRYDMSSNTWDLGPTFTSARAAFSLSIQGYRLFAVGGDANGGTYLDETADIESLDLNVWNGGDWGGDSPALPQARMFTAGGYCTEAVVGGEIWSVGGAFPDEESLNSLTEILYRSLHRQDSSNPIWQEAMSIPSELLAEATNGVSSLNDLQGQQGVTTNGNCYTGEFDLAVGTLISEGTGYPGAIVTYSVSLTNTGDIPDFWEISISSGWPTEIGSSEPIWPNMSDQLMVTVIIPMDAAPLSQDTATISFTSQGDPAIIRSLDLVTHRYTGVDLIPPVSPGSGAPGTSVIYPFTLMNSTNQTDVFNLELGAHNWETSLSSNQIGPISVGEVGTFTVTVNISEDAAWYSQDEVTITAFSQADPGQYSDTSQITTTAYAPPDMSYSPETLESLQQTGEVVTQTLTISNGNGIPLNFDIYEGGIPNGNTLLLHLDEPEGSNTFHDGSHMGNDGYCIGDSCPLSGVQGYAGNAVLFDGNDDFIQASTNGFPTGNSDRTMTAWVKMDAVVASEAFFVGYGNFGIGNQTYHLGANYQNLFWSQWGTGISGPYLELGNRYHIAVTNVGDYATLYMNGEPVGSGTYPIDTPVNSQIYLGRIMGEHGSDRRLNGAVDEVAVFDRALTAEEIMALYQTGLGNDTRWLSFEPISGSIPTNGALPIQVTFDANGIQPDTYTTCLTITSNDPINPNIQVPVSMTVEPTASMGWVEGVVTDQRTGMPLEAIIIAEGQPYTITTNADTGYYKLWLEPGTYTLQVSSPGYVTQINEVEISSQMGMIQDISLLMDAAWMYYDPQELDVVVDLNHEITRPLTLTNAGAGNLDVRIYNDASDAVLVFHLDEPAGATTFYDSSGYNNDGTCNDITCPSSGLPGKFGYATFFDGLDDLISIPDDPSLNPENAMTISAWINANDWNGNRRILQKGYGDNQYRLMAEYGNFHLHIHPVGRVTTSLPSTGVWHHVVGTYDGSQMQLWIDGELKAVQNASGLMPSSTDALSIGTKCPGCPTGDYFYGKIDEVLIFNRALSEGEIQALFTGWLPGDDSWLTIDPGSGSVPPNDNLSIQLTFDAGGLLPDIYTTTVYILSNDPINPLVHIPITMTVEPTPSMGWLEGTITDLRTGEPVEATITLEGQPYTYTSGAETGYYKLWLEAGLYRLQVNAPGYIIQTAPVAIHAGQGVTHDFALLLDQPWLIYTPESLSVTQEVGQLTDLTFTISNTGTIPLEFQITQPISGPVMLLHLDEPAGATTYYDYSGNGNSGQCIEPYCPIAAEAGQFGSAVRFDGMDDYIQLPELTNGRDEGSISLWAKIFSWEPGYGGMYFWSAIEYPPHSGNSWDGVNLGAHPETGNIDMRFGLWGGGWNWASSGIIPEFGEWYHLVGTWGSTGIQIYINGTLVGTNPYTGPAPTSSVMNVLGSSSWPDSFIDGLIDEVAFFNRTLSQEEVFRLYRGGFLDPDWLTFNPSSGSIPTNASIPVQVTFNAAGIQPDTYTTTLDVTSNDPLLPVVQIPITMTVEPTPSMGWVEGIVTDFRTGEPLEAMVIADNQRYTVTTDPLTGYYKIWMETISYSDFHTLEVSADGYITQNIQFVIHPQQGLIRDFALIMDAPWLEYSPESFMVTQMLGQVTTQTLTLSNTGTAPMGFYISEGLSRSVLQLHLDEPTGATLFLDTSGYDNNATCIDDSCLLTGEQGAIRYSVDFDGVNDYLSIPHSLEFDTIEEQDRVTIAAWINIREWYGSVFPIIDVYEADNDYGWGFEAHTSGLYFWVPEGSITWGFIPNLNEWYHLLISYDRGIGVVTFYVNGISAYQTYFSGDIPDTIGDPIYIGWSNSGPDEFSNGLIDELVVFDRILSPEEVMKVYTGDSLGDAPWLSVDPISGTIPNNSASPIQVTLDATKLQPEIYTSTLFIASNDPLAPLVQIPVSLTVELPPTAGQLVGTITQLGYCDVEPAVLPWAELLVESSTGITWTVTTDEAGTYAYWLDEAGNPYTVSVMTDGYDENYTTGVEIVGQQTTTQDFEVRWLMPCLDTAPEQLPMTLLMGMSDTLPLVITNTGAAPAAFELIERDSGQNIPVQGETIELNIPSGPEVAPVGSAVAAGPYTPRLETTYRIQPQAILVDPPRVLLLHADDSDGQWIRDQLYAYGDLAAVDAFNARFDTPTLDELQPYDVVLTWSNYPYADPEGIGDVLADYVDSGGYVINLMYALGEHGWEMEGRFMDEGYNAIQGGLVKYQTACLGEHHPTHFIFLGVEEVCDFYRLSNTSLSPGASAIARWQDGEIFVASNQDRSVISITGYVGYYYRWTGQMDRVVHNAILWFILGDDIPWLETAPVSGLVPADGGTISVDAIFDAYAYQPGEFAADLLLFTDDPMKSLIQIPVSLNIVPTSGMGWVEGVVTDMRTGEPVEATIIAEGQPYSVTSDADTGEYLLWLEQGTYTLKASAPGYVIQTVEIEIFTQAGSLQDFSLLLDAAWLQFDPEEFEITAGVNQVITRTLTLTNAGTQDMDYHLLEGLAGSILLLHLDEPTGSTTFIDASGYGNSGSCIGDSCPLAGVPGVVGTAVHFDGTNDYIEIPHNMQFDQIEAQDRLTIAAWVNIENLDQGWFAILDQYESTDDGGWEFTLYNSGIGGCDLPFTFGEWFHIAGTFDFSQGYGDYYFNGELICHFVGGSDIPDTSGEPAYIGFSPTGPEEYAAGLLDEIYVFNRALSAEEIRIIYAGGSIGDIPWLSVNPASGTVPVDSNTPVQVTFDATDLLPDTYTTTLFLTSNDPLLPVAEIPITMTVTGEVTPTSVIIDGVEQGWIDRQYVFTATVSPDTAGTPLTYVWQADEQAPITHTTGIVDTVSFTWDIPGTKVITVTASNVYGVVLDMHAINLVEIPYTYYLPLVYKGDPITGTSSQGGLELGWFPTGTIGLIPLIPLFLLRKRRD